MRKVIYNPKIYAYKIKNKCSSKSTDGSWGLSTASESQCPLSLHRMHLGELTVQEPRFGHPLTPAPPWGGRVETGGRAALWRRT